MSETNSPRSLEQTRDDSPRVDAPTLWATDACGSALFECLGIGGMGEVYRCGDGALQRDLALKILKAELRGDAAAEARFLREARLTGSLQHPGIVPIHYLGRRADGRPCYTMKLVRGRTLADLLRNEPVGPERLPRLLAVVEKVCQAVAFAHSKGVIHRDLKPSNVMVGEFGEVQVMDWGLAKELSRVEPATLKDGETVTRPEEASGPTRAGLALGTPAYMPPEQAAGDWEIVDERADVFALGAVLCEVLTGRPPYRGANHDDLVRRARRGELAEALAGLEQCGADETLTALCRECLAAELVRRPRHAGVVAERMAAYEAAVQERLRRAELERVAAEARAVGETERAREAQARVKAERRAKRRTLALAAALLVLLAGSGGGLWWRQLKQDRTDRAARAILEQGRERLEAGWRWHDLALLREAKAEAERAVDLARGGVSAAVEQQVADFDTTATALLARAEKNRDLLNALLDIAAPHETKTYRAAESGGPMLALAEPSVDEQYAAAFRRRWPDVDIENQAESAIAARLREEPEVVLQGVIAGLDGWMLEQRRQKRAESKWRRLLAVVERLDPSEPRRQLRALLIGAAPPRAEDVGSLLGGWPPWIALWKLGRGNEWRQLRQLREQIDMASEPVLTVLLLAQASRQIGDVAGAEEVLRLALARRPDEVALLDALAKVLERQGSSRLAEATGCYRAARARQPVLGLALGRTLRQAGQAVEEEAILRDLLRQQPNNPEILFAFGVAQHGLGKHAEAEAAWRKTIALQPDYALAYNNRGAVLYDHMRKPAEAEAAFRKAIALQPDLALAYHNLGKALDDRKKYAEAEAVCRKAVALQPDYARAFHLLSIALSGQGKHEEAESSSRKAIALQPDDALAYNSLGGALKGQGKHEEAEAAYRQAIALQPDRAMSYYNLGNALFWQRKYGEAEAACRKAIALKADDALAYDNLGAALSGQGKHGKAEAAYRQAIALQPDFAGAHNGLGAALFWQRKYREAEAACRKAVALQANDALAHYNLGLILDRQDKQVEAEAAYRRAIALKPNHAEAHCNLGHILKDQGRFVEALAVFRRGDELGSMQPGWNYPSPRWVRTAERLVELEKKLSAILRGEASPGNASDALTLAWMCQQPYQKRYAASARLYADAFTADPKLAADLNAQHRYNAACSAALAAAGHGEDARSLPDKAAALFRRWALDWLRTDLQAYVRLAAQNSPKVRQSIQQRLAHWRSDADLTSVREEQALKRLPDNERAVWQALWRDVDELSNRVKKSN